MLLPLKTVRLTRNTFDQYNDENHLPSYVTKAGFLSDGKIAWFINGLYLNVINTLNGWRIGEWTFNHLNNESDTENETFQIVCVKEIPETTQKCPLLVVGIVGSNQGGFIFILDISHGRIHRAISLDFQITILDIICGAPLSGSLNCFDGILIVGNQGGDVYVVDLCKRAYTANNWENRETIQDYEYHMLLKTTCMDENEIKEMREIAMENGQHLAIHLNVVPNKQTNHFVLRGEMGDNRIYVNREEVAVSGLLYCKQLRSLLIGYNFGALQLWNMIELKLIYTSAICDDHVPITHFLLQEPADDPKAFVYIWAIYNDPYQNYIPLCVLYGFCYEEKKLMDHGMIYENYMHGSVRLQMDLRPPIGRKRPINGYCLNTNILKRTNSVENFDENNSVLSAFVWNVCYDDSNIFETYVTIFDLNQWYKEQMPYERAVVKQIRIDNDYEVIYDLKIDENSLIRYNGAQKLDIHFSPNSLSFDLKYLCLNTVTYLHNESIQETLLSKMKNSGPLCLMEPYEIYNEIIEIGLTPLFTDTYRTSSNPLKQQRMIILNMALENNQLRWLCRCANDLANGSFLSVDCSLDMMISWAYERVVELKKYSDELCVCLFDNSGRKLDSNETELLNVCIRQIKNITTFYSYIDENLKNYLNNTELIENQSNMLNMISDYYQVLQWFLNIGLLPESDENNQFNYPYKNLLDFYDEKRTNLLILNRQEFHSTDSLLYIDGLIENDCGGKLLKEQWMKADGNGFYPPPSLQALLRTYLVENVDVKYKHSLVAYLLLDLVKVLNKEKYQSVIAYMIKFPDVFKVDLSLIKIIQAYWHLDNGNYKIAIDHLSDPLTNDSDLKKWHHKTALRSLFLHKQYHFALIYLRLTKPVMNDIDDILTIISLYVVSKMLNEALSVLRSISDEKKKSESFSHFFSECQKYNLLKSIIYYTLSSQEESMFMNYLKKHKNEDNKHLEIYHHILKSQLLEAFDKQQQYTNTNLMEYQGLRGHLNANVCDKILYNLKKLLPDVNKELVDVCNREKNFTWKKFAKPKPLSVFVNGNGENVCYKSTLINAALYKAKEISNDVESERKLITEETPFLRTPNRSLISKRSFNVINPQIDTENIYSSAKRFKISDDQYKTIINHDSKLETPVVKRQQSKSFDRQTNVPTPFSILKLNSKKQLEFENQEDEIDTKKNSLGLTPRKSLNRTPSTVRFRTESRDEAEEQEQEQTPITFSPKTRRNLKSTSLRSSPRLSSKRSDSTPTENTPQPDRKSLCRRVLEHNTLSKLQENLTETTRNELVYTKTISNNTSANDEKHEESVEKSVEIETIDETTNIHSISSHSDSFIIKKSVEILNKTHETNEIKLSDSLWNYINDSDNMDDVEMSDVSRTNKDASDDGEEQEEPIASSDVEKMTEIETNSDDVVESERNLNEQEIAAMLYDEFTMNSEDDNDEKENARIMDSSEDNTKTSGTSTDPSEDKEKIDENNPNDVIEISSSDNSSDKSQSDDIGCLEQNIIIYNDSASQMDEQIITNSDNENEEIVVDSEVIVEYAEVPEPIPSSSSDHLEKSGKVEKKTTIRSDCLEEFTVKNVKSNVNPDVLENIQHLPIIQNDPTVAKNPEEKQETKTTNIMENQSENVRVLRKRSISLDTKPSTDMDKSRTLRSKRSSSIESVKNEKSITTNPRKTPTRKTRSASVDDIHTNEDKTLSGRKKKSVSTLNLPSISEEIVMDTLSSRRITRRLSGALKDLDQSVTVESDLKKTPTKRQTKKTNKEISKEVKVVIDKLPIEKSDNTTPKKKSRTTRSKSVDTSLEDESQSDTIIHNTRSRTILKKPLMADIPEESKPQKRVTRKGSAQN